MDSVGYKEREDTTPTLTPRSTACTGERPRRRRAVAGRSCSVWMKKSGGMTSSRTLQLFSLVGRWALLGHLHPGLLRPLTV